MKFSKTTFSGALAAAAAVLALCSAAPANAQTLLQEKTSPDGLLSLSLWSSNGSDAVGVNNTYTWVATNNSATATLTGVILGSHWGDWCGGGNCYPPGPTLISLSPGCGGQSASEFPEEIAKFGVWCTPSTGVTLQPGQSVSGSVTLRPGAGGPADYSVYSGYNSPVTGKQVFATPVITNSNVVAPAATDIQISGSASTGSPAIGSTYTYTYQVKNAGPWGTYRGITFVDTLPDSLTYVSSSVTVVNLLLQQTVAVNNCTVVGQTVTCPLNELQNGGLAGQVAVTLTVRAPGAPQQIVNTASVHTVSPQTDSNPTNNGVTVTVAAK
ncbi:MAG TPA: DUF11 domain-containing protein [Burkholderiales bacterium]|nr:DUF11 domain-containing protein [Burkholderiales bacterium]